MGKNYYQTRKEAARAYALQWQDDFAERDVRYAELDYFGAMFYNLGRRWGLVREFRENGIPC